MINRIAIIGDIHGCLNTLTALYTRVAVKCGNVYCVGDLVDRGKYSKEVVEFCKGNKIKCVRGNHEDMLLRAIESEKKTFFYPINESIGHYFANGGDKTQYSYTGSLKLRDFEAFRKKFKGSQHYRWIKGFPLKYEFEGLIISHAGIIEGGNDISIIWNRDKPAKLDKMQIFGHTPLEKAVHFPDHFINIDTGCVYRNKLTAVIADTITGEILEIIEEYYHHEDEFRIG